MTGWAVATPDARRRPVRPSDRLRALLRRAGPRAERAGPLLRRTRPLLAVGLLVLLVHQLGAAPFLAGLRALDLPLVAAALALTGLVTACSAWRWRLVARGLGVPLGRAAAVAGCYRAQLLNCLLPGGVLGDVHRGVRSGREHDAVGAGLRAVGWERAAGQLLQLTLTAAVLLVAPSPVRDAVRAGLPFVLVGALLVLVAVRVSRRPPRAPSPEPLSPFAEPVDGGWRAALARDLRTGPLARSAWPGELVASTGSLLGCTALLLLASRAVGVRLPVGTLLPLLLLVLAAMAVPLGVGGWGPREGAAALLFGLAGAGAQAGVAATTVYGVLVTVGALPGLGVLALEWRAARAGARERA